MPSQSQDDSLTDVLGQSDQNLKAATGRAPCCASRDLRIEYNDAERAVKVERDKVEAEWISLTEVSLQSATKPQGGRREGGISGGCGRSLRACAAPNGRTLRAMRSRESGSA